MLGIKQISDSTIMQVRKQQEELQQRLDNQAETLAQQNEEIKSLRNFIETLQKKIKSPHELLDDLLLENTKQNHAEAVAAILKLGANIDARDEQGNSPLFLAMINGHDVIFKFLLDKKADISAQNKEGKTLFDWLSAADDIEKMRDLLATVSKDNTRINLLNSAYNFATSEAMKMLLVNELLLQAAKQGNISVVKDAVAKGANINTQDKRQSTALHYACYGKYIDVAKFLIEKKCLLTKTDHNQQTPADVAPDEIKQLIKHEQDKNASVIQAASRGFFQRKNYLDERQKFQQEIKDQSPATFAKLATEGKFELIKELAALIEGNRFYEAKQIILGFHAQPTI